MKWINQIGPFAVQRRESPRPDGKPYIPLTNPRAFVLHTTEGTSIENAWNTLNANRSAPHFLVGEGRIIQMRPLDVQAATLRDNGGGWHPNEVGWQVECVGMSLGIVNKLTPATWKPLVALTAFVHETLGIPLRRPEGWRDDLSDIKTMIATNNTRRQTRLAVTFNGLLHHLEIPDQDPTWHWDCGALNNTALIAEAEGDDVSFSEYQAGWQAHRAGIVRDPDWSEHKKFGWNARQEAVENPQTDAHTHPYAPVEHAHPLPSHAHLYSPVGHAHPPASHTHPHHVHGEDVPVP